MHTLTLQTKTYGDVHIHYNSDLSGNAIIRWGDKEVELPGEIIAPFFVPLLHIDDRPISFIPHPNDRKVRHIPTGKILLEKQRQENGLTWIGYFDEDGDRVPCDPDEIELIPIVTVHPFTPSNDEYENVVSYYNWIADARL